MLDLVGEEDQAIRLYHELAMRPEPHINALVNLAVLHEDRGEIHQAERCLRKVLEASLSRDEPALIEVPSGDMPNPWAFIDMPKVRGK